jgi:hypothetical protein
VISLSWVLFAFRPTHDNWRRTLGKILKKRKNSQIERTRPIWIKYDAYTYHIHH